MILLVDPLTPKEVAAEMRVHYETVMRWIRDGRLPATKIGREYRVARSDMEAAGAPFSMRCMITEIQAHELGDLKEVSVRLLAYGEPEGLDELKHMFARGEVCVAVVRPLGSSTKEERDR